MSLKKTERLSLCATALAVALLLSHSAARAAAVEPPPDPGFENSVRAADVIAEVEILAGGPFRSVARAGKIFKGDLPKSQTFELEGYNSFNWDTAHQGFATGSRHILFLSRTGREDVFAPLTPAASRLSIQQEGVLLELGDPPFRVPVRKAAFEEGLALLLEANDSGKAPERAQGFLQKLWDDGDIESRYLTVAMAGALRDPRAGALLIAAGRDKVLKLRLSAISALGRVKSPETVRALRIFLKDEKPPVAREAARVLAENGDSASLPELLEWVRRHVIASGGGAPAKLSDAERAKAESVAFEILIMALDIGPLLDRARLSPPLFEIARSKHEKLATAALVVLGEIAQQQDIPLLFELADDPAFDWRQQATAVLQRVVLKRFKSAGEFREWWAKNGAAFGEDKRREQTEAFVKALASANDPDQRKFLLDMLRASPGEIALVSAAPFLLENDSLGGINSEDMLVWKTALTAPYLIERLGRDTASDRQYALLALARLCRSQPRLKASLWPLVRAGLAEPESGYRRIAESAAGHMAQPEALGALLDSLEYFGSHTSTEAGRAVFELSCRTLGLSSAEPPDEAKAALRRLRGWWRGAEKNGRSVSPLPPVTKSFGVDLDPAERAAKLEAMLLSADSRVAGAAFSFVFAERPAGDALWQRMSAMPRQRDKAHGVLAQIGGGSALKAGLVARLTSSDESALVRALCLPVLASLSDAPGKGEALAAWLRGPAQKATPGWRRLGVICLGMIDNDPASLACLREILIAALDARESDLLAMFSDKPGGDAFQMLRPCMIALCARTDSTPLLVEALQKTASSSAREMAARALSIRRHRPAIGQMLKVIEKSEYLEWRELSQIITPLLNGDDAAALRGMLDSKEKAVRNAGAWLLAARPEIGADEATARALISALSDDSEHVRYFAAQAAGKRRLQGAVKELRRLLSDPEDSVRAGAAQALGLIADKAGCEQVSELYEKEWRPDARWLRALAVGGTAEQFELLLKAANSSLYAEQHEAIAALGAAARPAGFEVLLKIFRNDESSMQTLAADALAERGDEAVNALKTDLAGADRVARARALHLLSRINTPASRSVLTAAANDKDETIRALAQFALGRLGKQ
jgi:HEAT repeat protein